MKHVTIAIRMDSEFVKHLNLSAHLKYPKLLTEGVDKQITAMECLAILALLEARGALPEQVHMAIPHEWRPHIEAVSDKRVVEVT